MKSLIKTLIILSVGLVFDSCIDPVSFSNNKKADVLVVEGSISTVAGTHYVKLTRTAKYGDVFAGVNKNEINAKIYVRDDLGNVFMYSEVEKGQYKSPDNFAGEVGRSYSIFIETLDGKQYISNPELINEVPEIDSVFYEFKKIPTGSDGFKSGVDVKVLFKDTEEVSNYYKWDTKGTYKFASNPELYTPTMSQTPVPKDCCAICWLSEQHNAITILEDKLFQGNDYVQTAFFLEDVDGRFYEKYYIQIEQKSLSQSAYKFYALLKTQLEINGDIFDSPPTEITGNIISLSDPNEVVIGHFNAYDISTASFFIYGNDLPEKNASPLIPDDCRTIRNATTQEPSYWAD